LIASIVLPIQISNLPIEDNKIDLNN